MIRFLYLTLCVLLYTTTFAQNVGVNTLTPLSTLHLKGVENVTHLTLDADTIQSNNNPFIKLRTGMGSDLLWIHADDSTNTFIGLKAGLANIVGPQGVNNTFLGSRSGYSNTNGRDNTAIGTNALFSNTKASWNIAIGKNALYTQSFDAGVDSCWYSYNVAVGYEALYANGPTEVSNAISNTALGTFALRSNITGGFNLASGAYALYQNTFGNENTAIGTNALATNNTGSRNTALGFFADVTVDSLSNATAIGYNAKVAASNALVLGGIGPDAVQVGIGTDNPQGVLDVNGDLVLRSVPVNITDSINLALDVNTEKYSLYKITTAVSAFAIGGITAGAEGRLVTLVNQSGFPMQLIHEDPDAAIIDRIQTGNQQNLVLDQMGIVTLQYDNIVQRWMVNSSNHESPVSDWQPTGSNLYFDNFVGIGTEDPNAPLSIQTNLNEAGLSHMAMSGPDPVIMESSITDLGASIGTTSNNIFSLTAGGAAKLHVWPDGRIVIGEDADPSNFTGNPIISRMAPFDAKLTIESDINSVGWAHIGGPDSIIVREGIGGVSGSIGTGTNHVFRLVSNAEGRLHVYPDGNVVVGTNYEAPVSKFTVYTPNNTHGMTHISDEGIIVATNVGGISGGIGTYSPHIMRIYANSVAVMNIDPTGNVGIGVFNPLAGYKLSVNGNIKAKELVIETTGWPDYVFGADYKPLPLRELEAYIDQHHHLPNIPSAAELEKSGVAVGEMQKKMMEKIEELTLHILELNKRIESLENANRQ